MKIGQHSHSDDKKDVNIETYQATREAMIKKRKEVLAEMTKKIESFLDNWEGGMVAIVKNNYDENGETTGVESMITGVDTPTGSLRLSQACMELSLSSIDMVKDSVPAEHFTTAAFNILKEMTK